jgi:hypothetical protein
LSSTSVLQHDPLLAPQLDVAERVARGTVVLSCSCHPTQQGPDPCRQLLGDDRLGDVVVGARLETGHHVVGVGLGGDDDDRHDALGAQGPAHVEAGHVGQAQVEQHQVGLVLAERGQTVDRPSAASRTS